MDSGVKVTIDKAGKIAEGIGQLARRRVMVGIPAEKAFRDAAEDPQPINNAALLYIHEHGAPEVNIPARPSLVPGVEETQKDWLPRLEKAGEAALDGRGTEAVDKHYHAAGLVAAAGPKRKISEGVPPPLAESTLQARARRGRKGAKKELASRAAGNAPSTADAKPLLDTAQMRNAITHVLRNAKGK